MLNLESRKVGLEMNVSKTKIMSKSVKKAIKVENSLIEYVNEYTYLGKLVSFNENNNESEVERQMDLGSPDTVITGGLTLQPNGRAQKVKEIKEGQRKDGQMASQIAGKSWMQTAKDRGRWKEMEEAFTQNGAT
ncbi:uncharacterized protein LOC121732145 [Aricia agestis]|uniref:uncharacterized protein LOC121732145 n=1 Tax=Aricia agestis TaxID=91739 RepID=UPI001C201EDB|nr:uncharacterized protein LOC121732145 [Aricia agestis]